MAIQSNPISKSQSALAAKDLLTPAEFADGMPFSLGTLNNSRLTGLLLGVEAPKHYRFGRIIRYPISERQAWLERFQLAKTSSEHFHRNRK